MSDKRPHQQVRDPYDRWRPRDGFCEEPTCRAKLPETKRIKRFCTESCYIKYKSRASARGAVLWEMLLRWRTAPRSHQKGAKNEPTGFSHVTRMVDEFIRQDREMNPITKT